jgi:hypothetical protein
LQSDWIGWLVSDNPRVADLGSEKAGIGARRKLTLTSKGVTVTETSSDLALIRAIGAHAQEVSVFVRDGMPAMMRGMMGG